MALFDVGMTDDFYVPPKPVITDAPDFYASHLEQSLFQMGISALTYPVTSVYNKTRELGQGLLRNLIFPAASKKFHANLNADRLESSRKKLREFGGVNYIIQTPDGIQIDTMYMTTKKFREKIIEMGGQFKTKIDAEGKRISVIKIYNWTLHHLFQALDVEVSRNSLFAAPGKPISRVVLYKLDDNANTSKSIDNDAAGVSIVSEGNGGIYEFNRKQMINLLMLGSDVIAPNIRGTGRSTGVPTENGTYIDYESVYQLLSKKLNYPDHKITALGYCLGTGPSSWLASKHPINLDIDRSFNKLGDVMGDAVLNYAKVYFNNYPKLLTVTGYVVPPVVSMFSDLFIISYHNGKNVKSVRGSICLVEADKDKVIPKDSMGRLKNNIDKTGVLSIKIIFAGGHCDAWDDETDMAYKKFMAERGTLRNYGTTAPLLPAKRIEGMGYVSQLMYMSALSSKIDISTGSVR